MGTVSTNEFRKKLKIMVDGQPYEIIENQFVKPGKGQAFNRVREDGTPRRPVQEPQEFHHARP